MDSPFKQYHEGSVAETDSKRIIDRVNAQIAPGGMVSLSLV